MRIREQDDVVATAAVTDFARTDHLDPGFLEQLVPGAIRLSLARGETKVQDIRIARLSGM